ncbi:MAG TPA: FGGY family carbohydrate kinase [Puia sp.]|nr:FGGY family carbohydrate kinase [Puia sp.]
MIPTPVIAIFDVGKTNKKIILFDEQYHLAHEENMQLPETIDDDGFPCEDISALSKWLLEGFRKIVSGKNYDLRGVQFTAYGASFVHLDNQNRVCAPLYNYLKPYPQSLQEKFYNKYGGKEDFSKQTASPVLGNLNSGLQLYWLKHERPALFHKIKFSLHLPQWLSFVISGKHASDITSIGCHTCLWDFSKNNYHQWVDAEGIRNKFAHIHPSDKPIADHVGESIDSSLHLKIPVGTGLHDSSAALIPYLAIIREPFVLISTGTWSISLNPFNHSALTNEELEQDCLCYLSYTGEPVKASRLFAGHIHEEQTKKIADHFNKSPDYYSGLKGNIELLNRLYETNIPGNDNSSSFFYDHDLNSFSNYEEAYYHLMFDLIIRQTKSTKLILKGTNVKKIFVDGGFGKNSIYMQMLRRSFPDINISTTAMSQATALGAALSIHSYWNSQSVRTSLIYE